MTKTLFAAALLAGVAAVPASAATVYAADETGNLVSFDSSAPTSMLTTVGITGTSATMLALDFRPSNNQLYGLGDDLTLYQINRSTAVATAIGGPLALSGTQFAFDFNPAIDRLRIVSNSDQNYVINPTTGVLETTATPVAYGAADANAGKNAIVAAAAYTPSAQTGVGGDSRLFVIDSQNEVLARQNNNGGVLTTVGATGVVFGPRDSFDIDSLGAGYAQDGRRFYTVDLATGAFSLVGLTDRALYGIAVAAVPEPASWALMIGGFGLVGGVLRRRARPNRSLSIA